MTKTKKHDLWEAHLRDEKNAHDLQQASAGPTHQPVERPLPHTAREMNEAVQAAVDEERERCAAIARRWASDSSMTATEVAQKIADEISGS